MASKVTLINFDITAPIKEALRLYLSSGEIFIKEIVGDGGRTLEANQSEISVGPVRRRKVTISEKEETSIEPST